MAGIDIGLSLWEGIRTWILKVNSEMGRGLSKILPDKNSDCFCWIMFIFFFSFGCILGFEIQDAYVLIVFMRGWLI